MPHRQVIQAGKLGAQFAAHARRHARRVATSATEPYRDYLEPGQEFLDLYQYQLALGENLEVLEEELIAIDDLHFGELETDRQIRQRREALISELREALLKLKATVESNFGKGVSREIFKEDPRLPKEAKALRQMGQRVFDTLTDPRFQRQSTQPGVIVNPRLVAQGFAEPLNQLGVTLKQLNDSESETHHTQSRKDEALERLLEYDGKVARYFEAFYDLAGHKRLANRLRQSSHVRAAAGELPAGGFPADDDEDVEDGGPVTAAEVDVDTEVSPEEAVS